MNKTDNYNLSQWSPEDRIEMKDFNADNAAIEAALTALKAEDTRLNTELAKKGLASDVATLKNTKLQFDTLLDKTITLSGTSYSLDVSGPELGNCVLFAIAISGSSVRNVSLISFYSGDYGSHWAPGASSRVLGMLNYSYPYTTLGVYFPMRMPSLPVHGLGFINQLSMYFSNCTASYNNIKSLYFGNSSGNEISGTVTVRIYGLR